MRNAEDKIVFQLNANLPTISFSNKKLAKSVCNEIEARLADLRKRRSQLIYKCARENQLVINDFKNEESLFPAVRTAHYNIRVLKSETSVEEIVIRQTDKLVHERCRKEMS